MKTMFRFKWQVFAYFLFLAVVSCQSHTSYGYFPVTAKQVAKMTSAEAKAYLYNSYGIKDKRYEHYLAKAFKYNNPVADVSLLLKAGADPNAIINKANGITLAHMACHGAWGNHHRGLYVLQALKDYGADFNKTSNLGHTPLHYAVQNRYEEACEYLLETCNVDTEIKNNAGFTPLLWGAYRAWNHGDDDGRIKNIVRMLINHGADIHATAYDGKVNILNFYIDRGDEEFASYLRQLGVKYIEFRKNW